MNHREACIILEKLLEGIHPLTGEILPEDHVCSDPQVLRALHKAISALNHAHLESSVDGHRTYKRSQEDLSNNQALWTPEDDIYLRNACAQGIPLQEICSELCRSEHKVKFRLVYLGLADRTILGNSVNPESSYAHQGLPWYPEEEDKLTILYNSGCSPKEISSKMKRSVNSVMARLEKLGLIADRHVYTAPDILRF
ncbi:MAG: hypothetical protein E7337_03910 [Clostridiales bacterium]|nr:hypothetical protein [Clostridiales bacterium]